MRRRLALLALAVGLGFAAPAARAAATHTVNGSTSGGFAPKSITIRVNDTVTWHSADGAGHNATSPGFGPVSFNGVSDGSHTFTQVGVFDYICTIHGAQAMSGRVTVQAPPTTTPTTRPPPPPPPSTTAATQPRATTPAIPPATTTTLAATTTTASSTTTSTAPTSTSDGETTTTSEADDEVAIGDDDGGRDGGGSRGLALVGLIMGLALVGVGLGVMRRRAFADEEAPGPWDESDFDAGP
jgi:plastocyanin